MTVEEKSAGRAVLGRWGQQGLRGCAGLVVAAAVGQVLTAGFGIFGAESVAQEAASFDPHRMLGYVTELVSVVLLAALVVAGPSRRQIALGVGLFALMLVQPVLQRWDNPLLGALHAGNAVLVIFVALALFRADRRDRTTTAAA